MNVLVVLVAGIAIGLAVAAPLGPVNLMVLRGSFAHNWKTGFTIGAGALTADVILAALAAFGVRSVEQFVVNYNTALSLVAGIVLLFIGFSAVRSHTSEAALVEPQTSGPENFWKAPSLAWFLTIANPGSLLGFLALFSGMSNVLQLNQAPLRPWTVVAGVAIGGGLWWLTISFLAAKFKRRFSAKAVDRVNHWTGVTIIAFGFVLLFNVAEKLV